MTETLSPSSAPVLERQEAPPFKRNLHLAMWVITFTVTLLVIQRGLSLPVGFDEAYNAQVSLNWIRHGVPATVHGDSLEVFDPAISTGPTVTLPLAGAFWLFGIKVHVIRMVMAGFLILYLVSTYLLLRRFMGPLTALFGCLLPMLLPNFTTYSMEALGEIPAMAFTNLGFWYFLRWNAHRAQRQLAAMAGLCIGLAVLTKTVMAIGALALVVFLLLDQVRKPSREAMWGFASLVAAAVAPVAAWYAYQVSVMGPGMTLHKMVALPSQHRDQFMAFALGSVARNISNLGNWMPLAVLTYCGVLSMALNWRKVKHGGVPDALLPIIFTAGFGAWWVLLSASGWQRHALPFMLMGCSLTAILGSLFLTQLASQGRPALYWPRLTATAGAVLAGGFLISFCVSGLKPLLGTGPQAASQVQRQAAAHVKDLYAHGHMLLGWGWWMAWDLALLADVPIHNGQKSRAAQTMQPRVMVVTPLQKALVGLDSEQRAFLANGVDRQETIDGYDYYFLKVAPDEGPTP